MTASPHAALALDIIREWLEFFELDYTSSTLVAEARLPVTSPSKNRSNLLQSLQITPNTNTPRRPVLIELLAQVSSSGLSSPASSAKPSPIHIDSALRPSTSPTSSNNNANQPNTYATNTMHYPPSPEHAAISPTNASRRDGSNNKSVE